MCVAIQCSKALCRVHYGLVIEIYIQTIKMRYRKGMFYNVVVLVFSADDDDLNPSRDGINQFQGRASQKPVAHARQHSVTCHGSMHRNMEHNHIRDLIPE